MSKDIKFNAMLHGLSKTSIGILCLKGNEEGTQWSHLEWFPKSVCSYEESGYFGRCEFVAPEWLLEKKKILNLVDKI